MFLGITGAIGAGKGTIVEHLKARGFTHISVSGFLAAEAARRGLPATRISRRQIGNEYRAKSPTALIETVLADHNPFKENIIIESLHTPAEVRYVQYLAGKVFSVDAPLKLRWHRIQKRGGEKDPASFEDFVVEENRQMTSDNPDENNIVSAMQAADYQLENTGSPKELFAKVDAILATLL